MEHIINSPRVVGWLGRGFGAQNRLINIGALRLVMVMIANKHYFVNLMYESKLCRARFKNVN